MKTIKEYFLKAQKEKFALGAFNAGNLETIKAIVQAAVKLRAPVIIESSHGETDYFGSKRLVDVIRDFRDELEHPIFLNLDHSPTQKDAEEGIKDGYDLIHFDGGLLPFDQNVSIASKLVTEAHAKKLLVEGEIDHIMGSSGAHLQEKVEDVQNSGHFTDPAKALEFVQKTNVDTFASFVGNVHGFYAVPKRLRLDILEQIRKRIPQTFLSLHGGSGIPREDIQAVVSFGIVKINVNSELRIAYRQGLEATLEDNPNKFAIYEYMPQVIEAVQKVVEEKIKMFGGEGKI